MACGGIIAATQDNNAGISGIAPNSKLMFLKISDAWGKFTTHDVMAQAFDFATDNNADVISCSWGTNPPNAILNDAIDRALTEGREGKGCIVVFAAGNEGDIISYPGYLPGVITVGAIDRNNNHWSYSNTGPELELVAPSGAAAFDTHIICQAFPHIQQNLIILNGDVWTTDIAGLMGINPEIPSFEYCEPPYFTIFQWDANPIPSVDYTANFGGTSAAAPQVAGVAALILAINQNLSLQQVTNILNNSADELGATGYDTEYGWGRLNAYKALKYTLENYGGTLTQSLTIPVGETWNFNVPGAQVTLDNGASIIVNGTLNTNGTSSDAITFDFITKQSNNGIKVNSGGTVNIYYSDIKNAVNGIYINSGTGTVDHCTITNCNYGIYVTSATPTIQYCSINNNFYGLRIFNSYSQSWTAINIANNSITGNTAYGVYLYNSSPTLTYNTVTSNYIGSSLWLSSNPILNHNNFNSNSNHGVACYGNASPSAYYNSSYSFGGYNKVISNGNRGIVVTSTSHPNFGNPGLSTGGYNSIYDNTGYEIDNSAPNFFACNDWWNNPSGPQPGDINGTVRTVPYLDYDPNPSQNRSGSAMVSVVYSDLPDELQEAEYEMTNNNYQEATQILSKYLIEHTDDNSFGSLAAVLLLKNLDFYLDQKGIAKEVESFLKNKLSRDGQFELLLGLSSVLSKDGNYSAALDYLEKLEELNPTVEENNKVLFQKAFINLFGMQDLDNVLFYLNEILERNESNSLDYNLAMEEINSLSSFSDLIPKSNNKEISTKLPATLNLLDNYPNPFNPTTTIDYSIPEASFVELKIYDILGGEVASLVNENKLPGKHSVKFNAENLPSGIYFYRIVSGNFTATKKLILLK